MAADDPDFHIRDLHAHIAGGGEAAWRLEVQIMPLEDAPAYRFNPFDLTKVWPHRDYPPVTIGRMVLNRNPENYFAEVEQAAFEPANMVPGIEPSPDRMLLGRLFSYPDTHRHRIGVNYLQLPINRPLAPVHSYNKDGAMRYHHSGAQPVYAPNSFGGPAADPARFGESRDHVDGDTVRAAQSLHAEDDDYAQAGSLYRDVLTATEREHLAATLASHLSKVDVESVLERSLGHIRAVDADLGASVATRLGRGSGGPSPRGAGAAVASA
jgi:catalase